MEDKVKRRVEELREERKTAEWRLNDAKLHVERLHKEAKELHERIKDQEAKVFLAKADCSLASYEIAVMAMISTYCKVDAHPKFTRDALKQALCAQVKRCIDSFIDNDEKI